MSITTRTTKEIICFDRSINKVLYRSEDTLGPNSHQGQLEILPKRGLDKDYRVGTNLSENILVVGSSGSGKTTAIREYATNYRKINPENQIFLVTQSKENNLPKFARVWTAPYNDHLTYEQFLKLEYIPFEFFLSEDKIDITKTFKKCLIIFDDFLYFVGADKEETNLIRQRIVGMILQILNLGRKVEVSTIISSHLLYERKLNDLFQSIYAELNKFIFSPKRCNRRQLLYVLKTYFGLTNDQIETTLQFDPKAFMVTLSVEPAFLLSNNRVLLK